MRLCSKALALQREENLCVAEIEHITYIHTAS